MSYSYSRYLYSREPKRPVKNGKKTFFNKHQYKLNTIYLRSASGYITHMPLKEVLNKTAHLTDKEKESVTLKCPYRGNSHNWRLEYPTYHTDEELEKMYSKYLEQYEEDMEKYKKDHADWKAKQEEMLKAEYERKLQNLGKK